MISRKLANAALIAVLSLTGAQLASAAPASAAPAAAPDNSTLAVRVLTYDVRLAGEFVAGWDEGARIWNAAVPGLRLQRVAAGQRANIIIRVDNGWPRAFVTSLGNGTVYMGRTAVNQGHYVPRITAHELGHILGLPDRRTGLCADLMSGSSAPVSCRNPQPNSRERAEVARRFPAFAGATTAALPASLGAAGLGECFHSADREHAHV